MWSLRGRLQQPGVSLLPVLQHCMLRLTGGVRGLERGHGSGAAAHDCIGTFHQGNLRRLPGQPSEVPILRGARQRLHRGARGQGQGAVWFQGAIRCHPPTLQHTFAPWLGAGNDSGHMIGHCQRQRGRLSLRMRLAWQRAHVFLANPASLLTMLQHSLCGSSGADHDNGAHMLSDA